MSQATETPVVKKGNASWKPHQSLQVTKTDPNRRYKWANKDDLNLERKLHEGWDFCDKPDALHMRPKTVEAGSGKVGSKTEYRDLILMSIPEERAKAREAYYAEQTAEQTKGLKHSLDSKLRGMGPHTPGASGKIVIE